MATVPRSAEAERHDHLLVELLGQIAAYNPNLDADQIRAAFDYACDHHAGQVRKSGEPFILPPVARSREICAELKLDSATIAAALLHDTVEDTDGRDRGCAQRSFGDDVALLVDGVTKLTADQLRKPRAGPGRELPQDDRGDGAGPARRADQARRPPAQHAHHLGARQAEAGADRARDARDLRPARPPAGHPLDQVGARGPRVRVLHPRRYAEIEAMVNQTPRRARAVRRARRRRSCSASWRRPASPPTSPAAPSTSTRSTTRWRRAARSSTRSTT